MVDPRDDNGTKGPADDIDATTLRVPVGDVTMTTFTPTDDAEPVCTEDGVKFQ